MHDFWFAAIRFLIGSVAFIAGALSIATILILTWAVIA